MTELDYFPRVVDSISNEVMNLESLMTRPENFVQQVGNSPWFVPRAGRIAHLLATVWSIREQKCVVFASQQLDSGPGSAQHFVENLYSKYGHSGFCVFSTSGSTGFPKIVVHSHDNLLASAKMMVSSVPSLAVGAYWHVFPHYYMAGVLNSVILPWIAGQEIVLSEAFGAKTPFQFAEIAGKFGLKNLWLSPSMIRALSLRTKQKDWRAVNTVVNATGPISRQIHGDFVDRFETDLHNSYGSTEQLFISVSRDGQKFSGVGKLLDGVSLEILGGGDRSGSCFRICSPTTALAVFEQPSSTTQETTGNEDSNCILSADIGLIKSGNLWLAGRADDIVVIGGENVSLHHYEMVAKEIPGVIEAVARARDSFHFSSIDVFLELSPRADPEKARLEVEKRFLQILGSRRSPGCLVLGPIPRLKNGKPDRQKLRGGFE